MDLSRSVLDTWSKFIQQAEANPSSELEVRFSTYIPRDTVEQSDVKRPTSYKFKPWVDETSFHRLHMYLCNLPFSCSETETDEYLYAENGLRYVCSRQGHAPFYLRKVRDPHMGNYDILQYGLRLSLAQEHIVSAEKAHNLGYAQQHRYKRRMSFIDPKRPMVRYDLTKVTTTFFSDSAPCDPRTCYEVEIEWVRQQHGQLSDLLDACHFVLRVFQSSFWLITLPERSQCSNEYAELTGKRHFIGAQPESLQRKHLSWLTTTPYSITEKIDGERCLLLIRRNGKVCLFSRNLYVRDTGLTLHGYEGTLLDIELVNNYVCHVFDLLYWKGQDIRGLAHFPLRERLRCAEDVVKAFGCPERVLLKHFVWNVRDLPELIKQNNNVIPKDGFIFTPLNEPYPRRSTWSSLLKWKPPELNTIDFQLVTSTETGRVEVHVGVQDKKTMPFKCPDVIVSADLLGRNGCIVECAFDKEQNAWRILRVREDKVKPNFHKVAENVWDSILNPVSFEHLLQHCTTTSNTTTTTTAHKNVTNGPANGCHTENRKFDLMRAAHNRVKIQLIQSAVTACKTKRHGLRVLDVGCGRGGDIFKWDKTAGVTDYVGLDVEPTFLAEARRRSSTLKQLRTEFYLCDMTSSQVPEELIHQKGTFDIVSCQFCFHYFYKSAAVFEHVMATVRQLLKDDGILILTMLDGMALWDYIVERGATTDQDKDQNDFHIMPVFNTKQGLDVLRRQEFGNAVRVQLNGDNSLILNQYDKEEYLVFADLFVKRMALHNFALEDTDQFRVNDKLCASERVFSDMNRWYRFRKKSNNAYDTVKYWHMCPTTQLQEHLVNVNDTLKMASFSYPLEKLLSMFLGMDIQCEETNTRLEEKLTWLLDHYTLNLIFGMLKTQGTSVDFIKYLYPPTFAEDVRVMFLDQDGRLLAQVSEHHATASCLWDPCETILQELRTNCSASSNGSMDAPPSMDSEEVPLQLLGKNVEGRGKNAWSLKELRDLAQEHGISIPSSAKKKHDIAVILIKVLEAR